MPLGRSVINTASALFLAAALASAAPPAASGLALSASRSAGGIDVREDWRVHLEGATLTVQRFDDTPARSRRLSPAELDLLRRAVSTPGFATLRQNYGCRICVDAPFCAIEVTNAAGTQHVVRFAYHDSPPPPASAEGRALVEFHRTWALIKRLAGLTGVTDHCRPDSRH